MTELTQCQLRATFRYDSITGDFTGKIAAGRAKSGVVAGCVNTHGYVVIKINRKDYQAHRLAWLYVYGYNPENEIDHINRCKTDNRIENLREVSHQCNMRNSKNQKTNKSGIKGVCVYNKTKKWRAQIVVNCNQHHLGVYSSFDDAVCARLAAEQCLGWSGCDSSSLAYRYVKQNIQKQEEV